MHVECLVLYGSCARGDNNATSDVDMFGVTSEGDYRMVVKRKVNLALYPLLQATEMSLNGDLFMLHLVTEGLPLLDADGTFERIRASFRFKATYSEDVDKASQLGWAILDTSQGLQNFALINRRIAWCVRTILIARAAEEKRPAFSSSSLVAYAGREYVRALIAQKDSLAPPEKMLDLFREFLRDFGHAQTYSAVDLAGYRALFELSGNAVGAKTMNALASDAEFASYT